MNYYINDGIIHTTEAELDYTPLTEEQIAFYLENPNASAIEVLNRKLQEPYVIPIQQLIDACTDNYSKCEFDNIGASGAIKTNEYAKFGCQLAECPIALACDNMAACTISRTPKSLANINWVNALYAEMFAKIAQLESGERNISLLPSDSIKTKPYPYRDCEIEFVTVKNQIK